MKEHLILDRSHGLRLLESPPERRHCCVTRPWLRSNVRRTSDSRHTPHHWCMPLHSKPHHARGAFMAMLDVQARAPNHFTRPYRSAMCSTVCFVKPLSRPTFTISAAVLCSVRVPLVQRGRHPRFRGRHLEDCAHHAGGDGAGSFVLGTVEVDSAVCWGGWRRRRRRRRRRRGPRELIMLL